MSLTCKVMVSLLVGAGVCVIGCVGPDPFYEMAGVPAGPASSYGVIGEAPPVVRPPRLVPQLTDGPLSLAQCVWISLENNPRTRLSLHNVRAAAAARGQARALYLPQLELTGNAQRQKYQDLTLDLDIQRTTYAASFTARQLLLDGGSRRARLNAAGAALRGAAFLHDAVLLDVALDVALAYYNVLAAQSLLGVAEDTVRQRSKHLEFAQKRREFGLFRPVEVLQAKAEKDEAELAVVETRHQYRIMRGRLASAMGLLVSSPVEIVDIPEEMIAVERENVDRLLWAAGQNRPRLKAVVAEVTRIRQQLEAEKAARWPTVETTGSYGWRDTHLLPEEREEWTVALNVSLPIFSGFYRTYRIRQLSADLKSAIAGYENFLRDVELEVWEAYSSALQAEEAIEAAQSFVESARESLSVSEREYKIGAATIVELVDAQTALTTALNRKVRARLGWHVALAQLERAVGRSGSESGWRGGE